MQTTDGECIRVQRHHAQFVWREVGFPGAAHRLRTGNLFRIGQIRFINLRQTPDFMFRVKLRGSGITYGLQTTILVKGINTDAT
ncbi:Uncharacterised protein [Shigella flexneri]|nr:Uncharacterised protein [Shigella flexneri]